jgi:2-methylcitrate dehydratase PrpD
VDLSAILAAHVAGATFDSLPPGAVAAAQRSLLDALGVTLAASTLGEGCRPFVDQVLADGGSPVSTVVGFGRRVPPAAAALANGAMAHALDYEDAHDAALVHPNAQTVPAVLALAETRRTPGREVVAAIAVGCDLVCRLGLALRSDPAEQGWYPPAILQAFGAAAGAARILGLDATRTLDALSLTLAQVTGTQEMTRGERSVERGVRDAFGAHAGVLAAQLAERGVAGFDRPFEGDAGLFALYARGRYDTDALLDDLGRRYEGASVSFKPWPSCRGTHAAIAAALALRAGGLDPATVTEVRVVGSAFNRMLCEPRAERVAPRTAIAAKFSLPFTVARALVHGSVGLDAFAAPALADPAVLDLARTVRYEVDPREEGPGAATRCRLEVVAAGGAHRVAVERAPGSCDEGDLDETLRAKFLANAAHAAVPLSDVTLTRIADAVASLPASPDVARDLLARFDGTDAP